MSEKSITIEGKDYISSDRAAKLVGYTKDYVGQLARAGKIKSKRIGRSWYIEEESINKHKLSVHYILTKPKKSYIKQVNKSENTNINIDISVKPVLQEKGEGEELLLQGYIKNTNDSEGGIDLFPRLKDKKSDALLHTDIRYEKVNVPEALYSNHSLHKENETHHTHFKEVSIRKSLPRRTPRASFGAVAFSGAQPRIDGIIISNKKREHVRESVQISNKPRASFVVSQNVPTRSIVHEDTDKKETSKIIPVIGGIVLFTIFIVVYLVLSIK